jgi:hypothetical protein
MSVQREHLRPGSADPYGSVAFGVLRLGWAAVRLPVLALLVIFEPIVKVVLAGAALLVALTAMFFALVEPLSAFPFGGMLGVAAGLVLLLALYYALLRALSV